MGEGKALRIGVDCAWALTCGVVAASAQGPDTIPAGPMMQHQDQDHHGGMMGGGMMGGEMMGHGHGMMGHSMAMQIIFSLMDADGDGKLTLQEWQTAHERIFK